MVNRLDIIYNFITIRSDWVKTLDYPCELADLRTKIAQCTFCPRLVEYRTTVATMRRREFTTWTYWGRPVPGFGDPEARLLIVGLAPAAHGGNRTGRVFTGDRSGDFLFRCLHKAGFANQPYSKSIEDGLTLRGAYMTAAVKCAPPDNKPTQEETISCSSYLATEIELLPNMRALLCLGQFAFKSVVRVLSEKYEFDKTLPEFAHGNEIDLGGVTPIIFTSYHPSPRNTQTGKLSEQMMMRLLRKIRFRLGFP